MRILKIALLLGMTAVSLMGNWVLFHHLAKKNLAKTFQNNAYDRIRIKTDTALIELERGQDSWHLVSPFYWPANVFAIRDFLQTLQENPHPENLEVQLFSKGEQISDIKGTTPCDAPLWDCYKNPYFWLRSVTCPIKKNRVSKIIIEEIEKGKRYTLIRTDAKWKIVKPYALHVNEAQVESLLEQSLTMEWLPKSLSTNLEAKSPAFRVMIQGTDGQTFKINFSSPKDGICRAWLPAMPSITTACPADIFEYCALIDWKQSLPTPYSLQFDGPHGQKLLIQDETGDWAGFAIQEATLQAISAATMQKLLNDFKNLVPMGIHHTNEGEKLFEVLINEKYLWTFFVYGNQVYGRVKDAPCCLEFSRELVQEIASDLLYE